MQSIENIINVVLLSLFLRVDGWTQIRNLIQLVFVVGMKNARIMERKIRGTLFLRSNMENMECGCYDVEPVNMRIVRIMGHRFSI